MFKLYNFYSLFNMDHDTYRVCICTKIYNILQTELYINFFSSCNIIVNQNIFITDAMFVK